MIQQAMIDWTISSMPALAELPFYLNLKLQNLITVPSHQFPQCRFPPFSPPLYFIPGQTWCTLLPNPSRGGSSILLPSENARLFISHATLHDTNLLKFARIFGFTDLPQVLSQTRRPCTDGKNGDLRRDNENQHDDVDTCAFDKVMMIIC